MDDNSCEFIDEFMQVFLKADKKEFNRFLHAQNGTSMAEFDKKTGKQKNKILSKLEHKLGQKKLEQLVDMGRCNKPKESEKTNQWTTKVGEHTVQILLENIYGKDGVWRPKRLEDDCGYVQPDWETEDFIWEVKSRTYNTSGSAGEKVFGAAYKYCNVPNLYKKPLKIILIGYQEEEYKDDLFNPRKMSQKRKDMLKYYEDHAKISYVKGSSLLEEFLKLRLINLIKKKSPNSRVDEEWNIDELKQRLESMKTKHEYRE